MRWQVQVTVLGACLCAVLSVVLQGISRWVLLSICFVLFVWIIRLLLMKPHDNLDGHSPVNVSINNAPVMTQNQSPVITQKTGAPQLSQPRYNKAHIERKRLKIVWLEMNEWCTFKQSHTNARAAGILLPFYNNPTKSKVEAEFVRAHMIFRNLESREEISVDAAFWMEQEHHQINLRRGEHGDVLLVVYKARESEMATMQDNRSNHRVWQRAGFECATITRLPKAEYDLEVHLIWGGDDQFSESYTLNLDLRDPEELFAALPKIQTS